MGSFLFPILSIFSEFNGDEKLLIDLFSVEDLFLFSRVVLQSKLFSLS